MMGDPALLGHSEDVGHQLPDKVSEVMVEHGGFRLPDSHRFPLLGGWTPRTAAAPL